MGTIYRCLIVDDETPAHKAIASHLSKFTDLEHTASAYSGKEALKLLSENHFDIIFLDINMPLISGIELMDMQPVRPLTIITTAHSDYAMNGYDNDVVDYLLKPISFEKFAKAMEKARALYDYSKKAVSAEKERFFNCRVNGERLQIPVDDILYFESYGNYLKMYTIKSKRPVVLHGTLVNVLDEVKSPDLIRIHRTYILNRKYVKKVNLNSVDIYSGRQLPVGRQYKLLLSNL
ncbi:LytR/AlgR family response regulator transcription factor [Flavobacterium rhizosphaerae]|uniref:LytTR family DNA-binding domain-containing protein n=1 Tax=Flavobacterium rhizosphaerae TaxID=3163298 RepID=A0ABW8YZS9_9FLAO